MKKKCLLAGLAFSLLSLTGCTSAISLTEDEENMVAEYLANALLCDQDTYAEALIEPTPTIVPTLEPTPTEQAEVTQAPTNAPEQGSQSNATSPNEQANADFVEVMGMSNIAAEYTGYEVKNEISDGSSHLEASKGNELFVVKFDITNTSKKAKTFSLGELGINYMLDINTETKVKPLVTLKDNDLRFINVKIKAGEKIETLIMFEVKKDSKIDTANLIISREDKTAIVKIK